MCKCLKFLPLTSCKCFSGRNQGDNTFPSSHLTFSELDENHENVKKDLKDCSNSHGFKFGDDYNGGDTPNFELLPDIMGPETPSMRPLVPRFKRVQEDCHGAETKRETSVLGPQKRVKYIQDLLTEKIPCGEISESPSSKFEWLNLSTIRDTNGRRPTDPLYDKRTLYIPPEALRKMTASQKQYWTVKCKYMDVVLFFKVVTSRILCQFHVLVVLSFANSVIHFLFL